MEESISAYEAATRPLWVQPPDLDALWPTVGDNPVSWPYWDQEERGKYANLIAMSVGPDWEPPRLEAGRSITD